MFENMGQIFFFIVIFLSSLQNILAQQTCPVSCKGKVSSGFVEDYCSNFKDAIMTGRCCVDSNKTIGLDLRDCDVIHFNLSAVNREYIEILDLQQNEQLENVTTDELLGFVNLNYLYLPSGYICPGGNHAWNTSTINSTQSYVECSTQLKYCDNPYVCSTNGKCIHKGPGSTKCICKTDYFGYKCLHKGSFPMVIFLVILVISTGLISIGLWYYLRRHIIEPQKED